MFDRTNTAIALSLLMVAAAPAWAADGPCRLPDSNKSVSANNNRGAEQIEGSGRITDNKRALSGFKSLKVAGPFDIEMRSSAAESVTVRADDNLQQFIETRVAGDALEVRMKDNAGFRTRSRPRVVVEFVRMDAVTLAGSGNVIVDRIRADSFAVAVSGSNDMCIEAIETGTFGLSIAGSGDFRAKGTADIQGIRIAGSGDADLRDLVGKVVKISVAGSGDVRVHATDGLEVSIAGSGDVLYRGEPKIVRSVAGSGSIRRLK